jgi:hypothetical protein
MPILIIRQGSGLSRTDTQRSDVLDLFEDDLFLFLFPQMLPDQTWRRTIFFHVPQLSTETKENVYLINSLG